MWIVLLCGFQLVGLLKINNSFFGILPRFSSLRKRVIVQPTTGSKPLGENSLLLFGRVQAVLIGAFHLSNPFWGFFWVTQDLIIEKSFKRTAIHLRTFGWSLLVENKINE